MLHCLRLLIVLAVVVARQGLPTADAQDKAAKELTKKLAQKISLPNGIDANTPLKDALEYLSERYELKMLIDSTAFARAGIQKVEEQPVRLAKISNVELGKVLQTLLDQVKGTYQIDKDLLRIQPRLKK